MAQPAAASEQADRVRQIRLVAARRPDVSMADARRVVARVLGEGWQVDEQNGPAGSCWSGRTVSRWWAPRLMPGRAMRRRSRCPRPSSSSRWRPTYPSAGTPRTSEPCPPASTSGAQGLFKRDIKDLAAYYSSLKGDLKVK